MQLENKTLHFVGIGGIGMCGLAELLHNLGSRVTGSDIQENFQVQRLLKMGIPISIGHSAAHVSQDTDIVVYSSAIPDSNVELVEARRRGVTLIRRAEALAEMMRLKKGLVVAGTHGKTTTTALLGSIFSFAKQDPTVVAGGRLDLFQSTARLGQGEWFIAESDESDGSFLHLFPELVILTNIDDDHLNFYGSFDKLKKSFSQFLSKVPFYGTVIACGDCKNVREIISEKLAPKVWFYGLEDHNDFVLKREKGKNSVYHKNKKWAEIKTPLIGESNVLNNLAALVCGSQVGIKKEILLEGLATFKGVQRRMEFKGESQGVLFYDDYAHHPTEVEATLKGISERFPDRRKVVWFQPHRYTRFQYSWDKFLKSFSCADVLYLSEVYSANEKPLKGIDSQNFVKQIKHPSCHFVSEKNILNILPQLRPNDVFITLGAGSVYRLGEQLLSRLKSQSKAPLSSAVPALEF